MLFVFCYLKLYPDEGKRKIGLSSPEYKPVENPTMDDKLNNEILKSSDSVKQEKNDFINFQ